jgi:hypothetical protein
MVGKFYLLLTLISSEKITKNITAKKAIFYYQLPLMEPQYDWRAKKAECVPYVVFKVSFI